MVYNCTVRRAKPLGQIVTASFFEGEFAAHRNNKAVVFTNGCFDILHVGHIRYLKDAKSLGGLLVVGLNSDASVRRLKGEERPVQEEGDRAEVLAALNMVDYVCLFDEDTPLELIKKVHPDKLVKGGDWTPDKIVGSDFVLQNGGEVVSLPFHKGRSTTNIVNKIIGLG